VVKFRRHDGDGRKAENPRARGHASNWLPTRKRDLLEARISSCVANPVAASFPRSFLGGREVEAAGCELNLIGQSFSCLCDVIFGHVYVVAS